MTQYFLGLLFLLILGTIVHAQTPCAPSGVEGFGTQTRGGAGQPTVQVTTLANSGPGSLRTALSAGNRCIVFTVSGNILLTSPITIRNSQITIDGFAAPGTVTIAGYGILLVGPNDPYTGGNAHDIVIRGLRFTPFDNAVGADVDSLGVYYGAYNVVIERNTFVGPLSHPNNTPDEHVDVGTRSHDVTVAWNLLFRRTGGGSTQNLLVDSKATRVSIHHNLLSEATDKNPIIVFDFHSLAVDTDTTADFRNNLVIAKNGGEGADFGDGARANIINNYFAYLPAEKPPTDAYRLLVVCNAARSAALGNPPYVTQWCTSIGAPTNQRHDGYFYVTGNVTPETVPPGYPANLNVWTTQGTPFPAPTVTTTDASMAACQILAEAGRRPLQALEQQFLDRVSIPVVCTNPSVEAPSLLRLLP